MKTISQHVRSYISKSPFLEEVLSENIGNLSSISKMIKKEIENSTKQKVSLQSIVVALSRLKIKKGELVSGFNYLNKIESVNIQSGLQIIFCKNTEIENTEKDIINSKIEILSKVSGHVETIFIICPRYNIKYTPKFGIKILYDITSITLILPKDSISVPGVYYPILKKLSWNSINIVELVSVGQELTFYVLDNDTEKAFGLLNSLKSTV